MVNEREPRQHQPNVSFRGIMTGKQDQAGHHIVPFLPKVAAQEPSHRAIKGRFQMWSIRVGEQAATQVTAIPNQRHWLRIHSSSRDWALSSTSEYLRRAAAHWITAIRGRTYCRGSNSQNHQRHCSYTTQQTRRTGRDYDYICLSSMLIQRRRSARASSIRF